MENKRTIQIDYLRLVEILIKRAWVILLAALIGFSCLYYYAAYMVPDTYTASATMYVYNNNPNLINYQYTSTSDLNSAVQLLDTYMVVIKSDKVLDVVSERLMDSIGVKMQPSDIADTLSMGSVSETGVMRISAKTESPVLSREICNAVLDAAPAEIIRVVGAGSVEVIDYAQTPEYPNSHQAVKKGAIGAFALFVLSAGIIVGVFLLNSRVTTERDLTSNYEAPLLAAVQRMDPDKSIQLDDERENRHTHKSGIYLINAKTPSTIIESYKQLRTNLRFAVARQDNHTVIISSAVPDEGKSTISGNIALVTSQNSQRVLLIDGDMRKPRQRDMFRLSDREKGLSTVLIGEVSFEEAVHRGVMPNLDILSAGRIPPNPSELLSSPEMTALIDKLNGEYDLVIIDAPPINVVTDALVLSDKIAGLIFVVRQNFSDHKELRRALEAVSFTDCKLLGFVFATEELSERSYYYRRYYNRYYRHYYSYYHKSGEKTEAERKNLQTAEQQA